MLLKKDIKSFTRIFRSEEHVIYSWKHRLLVQVLGVSPTLAAKRWMETSVRIFRGLPQRGSFSVVPVSLNFNTSASMHFFEGLVSSPNIFQSFLCTLTTHPLFWKWSSTICIRSSFVNRILRVIILRLLSATCNDCRYHWYTKNSLRISSFILNEPDLFTICSFIAIFFLKRSSLRIAHPVFIYYCHCILLYSFNVITTRDTQYLRTNSIILKVRKCTTGTHAHTCNKTKTLNKY